MLEVPVSKPMDCGGIPRAVIYLAISDDELINGGIYYYYAYSQLLLVKLLDDNRTFR
jgi:hypothetical protein